MVFIESAAKNDLQRTIKYGAALYIVMALLATPAAICNYQHLVSDIDLYDMWTHQIMAERAVPKEISATLPPVEPLDLVPEVSPALPPFHDHIIQASKSYQVDAALIRAIIMVESSNNPKAVSRRGAKGLMQLMPTTAKWLGVYDSFDPALNIDGGVRYFKNLLDRFKGDVKLALAAYNAGSRYVRKYNGVPPFKATQRYIKKVLKYHKVYQEEMSSNTPDQTAV